MSTGLTDAVTAPLDDLAAFMSTADIRNLQAVWSHHGPGGTRPFMVLDKLSETGSNLIDALADHDAEAQRLIDSMLEHEYRAGLEDIPGDRQSVGEGKGVSVRVGLGGRRSI